MSDLTAREKIAKYCKVENKQPGGELLTCGEKKFRMSGQLDELTDSECGRAAESLGLDTYINKQAAKGKLPPNDIKRISVLVGKRCECGCGAIVLKSSSRFRSGHDMKLKAALRKTVRGGRGGAIVKAKKELADRGWD